MVEFTPRQKMQQEQTLPHNAQQIMQQDVMQAAFDFYVNHDPAEDETDDVVMQDTFTSALDSQEQSDEIDETAVAAIAFIADAAEAAVTHEARLWVDDGWTARVIKNEEDDGWAVAMCKDGESEPALVGPWTMGRDKKNPKPLDAAAFGTLVKTASEVLRRHEQQLHAMLHKSVFVTTQNATLNITLDIVPSDDEPYALLAAHSEDGAQIAQVVVPPDFKLSRDNATAWVSNGFRKPGRA